MPTATTIGMPNLRLRRNHALTVASSGPFLHLPFVHVPASPHGEPSSSVLWSVTHCRLFDGSWHVTAHVSLVLGHSFVSWSDEPSCWHCSGECG
jgi:hypothetical protein